MSGFCIVFFAICVGLWSKTAGSPLLLPNPVLGCMSIHIHFGAVIVKVGVTIGKIFVSVIIIYPGMCANIMAKVFFHVYSLHSIKH